MRGAVLFARATFCTSPLEMRPQPMRLSQRCGLVKGVDVHLGTCETTRSISSPEMRDRSSNEARDDDLKEDDISQDCQREF